MRLFKMLASLLFSTPNKKLVTVRVETMDFSAGHLKRCAKRFLQDME